MLGAFLLAILFVTPAWAQAPSGRPFLREEMQRVRLQGPEQNYRGDLAVESGQTLNKDVFVYDGNVEVNDGGRITGDLVVYSGNIEIAENATVDGDVTNFSGNIDVAGRIGGDLLVWSGNVDLASTANVEGDINVVSGDIERDEGASVSGDVMQGPSFRFPRGFAPDAPDAPRRPGVSFNNEPENFFGWLIRLIGRLFVAALMTAFTMLLVGGLFYLRPQWVADTRKQLTEHLALSAVVGAVANLTVIFLTSLLAITICLLPLALIPIVLLLAVNVVGWSVASQIVGERIVRATKQEVQPALTILVGALFLTGICALLWAFGGCFRFIAFLLIFVVSSLGSGAVLVPWVKNRRGFGGGGSTGGGNVPPSGPTPSGPIGAYDSPMGTGGDVQNAPVTREGEVPSQPVDEQDIAEPIDYITAEEINEAQEQSPAAPKSRGRAAKKSETTTSSPATSGEETVELDVAGPVDYVTAQEVNTTETITEGDDFLRIKGIGPTYARRLKDAGYASFAQVAAASPEEVAAAIGWPVDRVRRSEIIDQAKVLAQG
jgi:predicted flap endonuclease-1-like 5' DNA nuclease/cytoskeletal protein CcmA (bactofilin family)